MPLDVYIFTLEVLCRSHYFQFQRQTHLWGFGVLQWNVITFFFLIYLENIEHWSKWERSLYNIAISLYELSNKIKPKNNRAFYYVSYIYICVPWIGRVLLRKLKTNWTYYTRTFVLSVFFVFNFVFITKQTTRNFSRLKFLLLYVTRCVQWITLKKNSKKISVCKETGCAYQIGKGVYRRIKRLK